MPIDFFSKINNLRCLQTRKIFEPKAGLFLSPVTKHIGLNILIWLAIGSRHHANRVFDRDRITFCHHKPIKECNSLVSLVHAIPRGLSVFSGIEPSASCHGQICTRRMGNNHIPPIVNSVFHAVTGCKPAPSIDKRQHISLDMPFGMPSLAGENIAAVCFVTSFAECDADTLAHFAGD